MHARPRRSWARSSAAGCRRPPTAAARELMERIAPAGDVYQAGTLSGNPLAVAAGLATLRAARRAGLRCASRATTEALADGPARGRGGAPAPVQVATAPGPADRLLLAPSPVRDYAGRAGAATSTPTAPGAARCSRAASTRRRRSSRRGSRRSPTTAEHVERTRRGRGGRVRGARA